MHILSIGEVMIELSGAGPDAALWRSGFAGDTYNTAWYLAALCPPDWQVSYFTKVGQDPMSAAFVEALAGAGIGADWISRHPTRCIGLYMIALQGGERSFSYWRGESAARLMADDPAHLAAALDAADVVFLSGITLAILAPDARARLIAALADCRRAGRRVVFDPNIRPRLWESPQAARDAISAAAAVADIALPSFDDDAALFGDATPQVTAARYAAAGVAEVVVKNAGGPLTIITPDGLADAPPPRQVIPTDTTGAGDSFNAGYLAARLQGHNVTDAARQGHALAGLVVQHPGALLPRDVLARFLSQGAGGAA